MSIAPPCVTTVAELARRVDDQRVMSLIRPFISGVDFNDLKKRQVMVVHQSVKESVLNGLALTRPGLQNVEILPVGSPITSRLENIILNVCVRYLLLDEINDAPLFSDEQVAVEELPQDMDLFSDDNGTAAFTAFDIIDGIPDILVREGWGNELLCMAASRGCQPIIERLMKVAQQSIDLRTELFHGTQRQSKGLRVRQSIGQAVLAGHVRMESAPALLALSTAHQNVLSTEVRGVADDGSN
ncbi:hypothetical protein HYE68_008604 [Fusarium pseudograminearum]|nr:hypothetical protein HYE68_008604 [Fusarium pseudograminearum]